MTPPFDEYIHKVPGVCLRHMFDDVYIASLNGFGDEMKFKTHDRNGHYRMVKRSWNTFDESRIDWYLSGGYIGDMSQQWMRHLLLCWLGRTEEALNMLRDHAKEEYLSLLNGLSIEGSLTGVEIDSTEY